MIRLFRYDGLELMLNVDMIKDIRAGVNTVITLTNGEEITVKNSLTDVLTKIRACRKGIEDENREFDPDARRSDRSRKPPMPRPAPETAGGFPDPKKKEPL
jgi:uncharacterized protein YlzI (FlbEa/FlbD family)